MSFLSIFSFRSIQVKIAVWSGICVVFIIGIIITYAAFSLRQTAIEAAKEHAIAMAESKAAFIDAEIEVALDAARTLAQMLSAVKNEEDPLTITRKDTDTMIKELVIDNPDFLGVYTLWEPNAFDGHDEQYINTPGHDKTGRYMAYWNRDETGRMQNEPLVEYEVEGIGDYYLCPKKTGEDCVIGPYLYPVQGEDVLMSSQVSPILNQGKFYGIGGADLRLSYLQTWVDEQQLYDGTATLALIGNNGTLAAVTGHADFVGQPLSALYLHAGEENRLSRIQNGEQIVEFNEKGELEVFVPIYFGNSSAPWSMSIIVPGVVITDKATQLMWQLVAISVVLTIVSLFVLHFIAGQIAHPIKKITSVAQSVAQGNLNLEANVVQARDETGILAQSFNQMVNNLRQMVEQERSSQENATQNATSLQQAKEHIETVVSDYLAFIRQVSNGDLTARLTLNDTIGNTDALSKLGNSLNDMVGSLHRITSQVKDASMSIASAASEILSATTEQASNASQQSSAITETTTTVAQIRNIAQQTAQQADQVIKDSQTMLRAAKQGTQSVESTMDGMVQIRRQVESIAETILALSEQTQAIGLITTTVSELADQSNMLALNAAIEAARAGEQGKSFAVVAQQVRELAERSKSATIQVQDILNEIQRVTNNAVMVTEEGSKGVEKGLHLANQSGEVIHQIAIEVEGSVQANTQMSAAARQQMTGMEQIEQSMKFIQQATAQTLSSTRQAESATKGLHKLAQELQDATAAYTL